jgi:hypothetical protein
VIALAVMFSRRPVTLGGVFVMLGSLRMRFPGHAILLNDVATPKNSFKPAAVPLSGRWLPLPASVRNAFSLITR